ncbi:C2H2-type domain-containing protein [Pleurotus pulmonarius]
MSRSQSTDDISSTAGISIVVDRDEGEEVPVSSFFPAVGLGAPPFPSDSGLATTFHDHPTGPAWLDGVGTILSEQQDHDYFTNPHHQPSPEPDRYPPSPLLPYAGEDFFLNSPLVPSFNSLSISSPFPPSPSTDFDQHGHHSDTSFDFNSSPLLQLGNSLSPGVSSGLSSPSFLAVDRNSALFGSDKDPTFDRLPSLRVDTIFSSPGEIQHSPSPLSEPSPYPSSPFAPPSLTHSSPSAYSPHLGLPSSSTHHSSNYSALSGALDETCVSDSGLDLDEDYSRASPFISGSRRHSHTGLRADVPSILMGTALEEHHNDPRKSITLDAPGFPLRSSRSAVLTPDLPRLQLEVVGHEVSRGRAEDRQALSTPGSRRVSRSPYARPPPIDAKDASAGSGHKRNKTYDQFLNVPGAAPGMRLQPPNAGNTHHRRHSTGTHGRDSPPEPGGSTLIVPGPSMSRPPAHPTHRPSSSEGGSFLPPEEFKPRFYSPKVESPVAGPSRQPAMVDSLPEGAGMTRRSARVRAREEDPSSSEKDAPEIDEVSLPSESIRRETIASSATLKASGHRRKNEVKFFCPVCRNGFTAKHNLQRHLLAHSGKKPFSCNCGQAFTNKWDRTRHQKKSRIPACSK